MRAVARLARVVISEVAHHVTQRGNGRQVILANDSEREVYLDLLRRAAKLQGIEVAGYWRVARTSRDPRCVRLPRQPGGSP